jgi:L-serine kinase (ADP)
VTEAAHRPAEPTFRLLRLSDLLEHEEIEPRKVDALVADIRRTKVVADPIWVAAGSGIILNGHHRVAALRRLGAERVPAWVVEYYSPDVKLERWTEGPPIPKAEVERRATEKRLFPPKTTRHIVISGLAERSTSLDELMHPSPKARRKPQPRASRSPRRGAARSDTT